ncbi:MAG: glycosyltransferase [Geminicoccaceae bacterium]
MLVYYPRGFSESRWQRAHARGERAEASHWGMHHVRELGGPVEFTEDTEPGPVLDLLHRLAHRWLGVDLAHLVGNFAKVWRADEIWAMSERELVLLVLATSFRRHEPVLIGEAVWLLDEWPGYGRFRRAVAHWCLKQAGAVLICVEGGAQAIRELLPDVHVVPYRFGIAVERFRDLRAVPGVSPGRRKGDPLHVLAAGNDLRRDWKSVAEAVGGRTELETVLLSRREHVDGFAREHANIRYEPAAGFTELCGWYRWADVFVAPSKENLHGAGLTMLLEAAVAGVPVIAARTGFIEEYLPEDSAFLVPPGDSAAIRSALDQIRLDPAEAARRAGRARERASACDTKNAVEARMKILREADQRADSRQDGQGNSERPVNA